MRLYIDNRIIQEIATSKAENAFLVMCQTAGPLTKDLSMQVMLAWPSLLEYLDLGNVFENFPIFDQHNELFAFIFSLLPKESEKELLIHAYDQVFVECLTHVKALPQLTSALILQGIQQKRYSSKEEFFAQSLNHYEKLFLEHPAHAMHDLILYLAWDRVCVNMASIFEHPFPNVNVQSGLETLKECLLESFQHITGQGRTTPSFFRLVEALYAYDMREENLDTHTDEEWAVLCQSALALKPRESLEDVWYVDAAIVDEQKLQKKEGNEDLLRVFTLDSVDKVKASLSLVRNTLAKLKKKVPDWHYTLSTTEIMCLKETDNKLVIETIFNN